MCYGSCKPLYVTRIGSGAFSYCFKVITTYPISFTTESFGVTTTVGSNYPYTANATIDCGKTNVAVGIGRDKAENDAQAYYIVFGY